MSCTPFPRPVAEVHRRGASEATAGGGRLVRTSGCARQGVAPARCESRAIFQDGERCDPCSCGTRLRTPRPSFAPRAARRAATGGRWSQPSAWARCRSTRAPSGCVSTATIVVPGRGPGLDGPIVWAELFTAVSRAPGYLARRPNSLALARASSWEWAPRPCRSARMWLRTVACER
jgi:hypothetical protein